MIIAFLSAAKEHCSEKNLKAMIKFNGVVDSDNDYINNLIEIVTVMVV